MQCIVQEFAGYPTKCMESGAIWFKQHVTAQTYIEQLTNHPIFGDLGFMVICFSTGCEPFILSLVPE
jgi:hypothetical protein